MTITAEAVDIFEDGRFYSKGMQDKSSWPVSVLCGYDGRQVVG